MDQEKYEKKLINHIIGRIERYGGRKCLSSIILTGSLGRGEATYETDADGGICLRSDVEMALVFPGLLQKKKVETLIHKVSHEFKEDLNLMAVEERRVKKASNFNFSLITPRYKTLFTYDLFNGSRTIWGRDFIEGKEVALDEVDLYEAKRLVANRIGEYIYLQNTSDLNKKEYLRMQWKGKIMLAVASAWLIIEGMYTSSYLEQYERVRANKEKVEDLIGRGFVLEYEKTIFFLRGNSEVYEVPDKSLFRYIKNIDCCFQVNRIKKAKVNSFSRFIKYMLKYIKSGISYGICGVEDNILQSLLSDFWQQSEWLYRDADVWHKVLY